MNDSQLKSYTIEGEIVYDRLLRHQSLMIRLSNQDAIIFPTLFTINHDSIQNRLNYEFLFDSTAIGYEISYKLYFKSRLDISTINSRYLNFSRPMINYNFSDFKIEPNAFTYHQNGKMIGTPVITSKLQYSDFEKYFERPSMQMIPQEFKSSNKNKDLGHSYRYFFQEKIGSSKKRKQKTHGRVPKFKQNFGVNLSEYCHKLVPKRSECGPKFLNFGHRIRKIIIWVLVRGYSEY